MVGGGMFHSKGPFLIDSHCHLSFKKFIDRDVASKGDNFHEKYAIQEIVRRANDAGVKYILTIGVELSDMTESYQIIKDNECVFRTVGVHALEAQRHHDQYSLDEIEQAIIDACRVAKTVGIGEIGLDYHYERDSAREQKEIFNMQMELARKLDLPVCVHSRDAEDDTIAILKDHPGVQCIIHCFTGSREFAFRSLDLGHYISASGVITFKNSLLLQETVAAVPIDRLLVETDAPFLAPMPFRGEINEPAFVVHTAKKVADLLRRPINEIAEKTSENFLRIFNSIEDQ